MRVRSPWPVVAVLLLFQVPAAKASPCRCPLMENDMGAPVVTLDAAAIDSVGTVLSDGNMKIIERIDAAYRDGYYGEPGKDRAKENALAAFIYAAETAFDFVARLATQSEVIYSTGEDALRVAFTERFRNPGIYPIINLRDARTGFGHFCLAFDVESDEVREIEVGGDKMRGWAEVLDIEGESVRVANIDMKTFSHDRVHLLYEEVSCGEIHTYETEMDHYPVRVYTMEGLEGQYVRKWGFHRTNATVIWKSISDGIDPPPAGLRFLGSAAYFPALRLELPWFLPNVGLEDLRRFEYPEPVLTLAAVDELRARDLDWLEIRKNMRFADWEGDGTIPDLVNEKFPDH